MATLPKPYLTAEEYLALERQAEFKSEYVNGEMFAMAGTSENHALLVTNLVAELRQALRRGPCRVYSSDMRVCVSPAGRYTYPDVVVACEKPKFLDGTQDTLLNPTLLIEVLSPSTADYDRGGKFQSYRTLASLEEYLTVAQDQIHMEQWHKQPDGRWILTEYTAASNCLRLESLSVELSIADIYEKVTLDEPGETR
ncbi:MAG: Uma2 family endonuclease [Acidobacteriaceae bacterium]|nr:Uma2 family endonuclease [Acidobacteriaceae bacterium]